MLDLRALINDRSYLTTFIVGNRYVTVWHRNKVFEDILAAIDEYLDGELKKPFVILSSTFLYREDGPNLNDRELVDIFLE